MIHLLDRYDQVHWLVDKDWLSFQIKVHENKRKIYDWLEQNTTQRVVISGQGQLPPSGDIYHPTEMIFRNIAENHYRIYFQDPNEALLFKLAWGGAI